MPNRPTVALFQLIKSLKKSEKRNFKLYVKRNSATEDLKIIHLFDALDKMEDYDEELLLKKNPSIKKLQLSNLNASLFEFFADATVFWNGLTGTSNLPSSLSFLSADPPIVINLLMLL